jgi:hypothetical protein
MATFTSRAASGLPAQTPGEVMGIADKDYFTTKEGTLAEGEADAAFLLIRKGKEIPKHMADKYPELASKVAQPEEAAEDAPEKAATPKANKSRKPASNKGVKE